MNFSKIDLHLHLDGSLNPELAYQKAVKMNLINKETKYNEFRKSLVADDVTNLEEYLEKFDIPIKLLKNKESIFEFTYDLIERLANDNVRYAEIRFAPQFMNSDSISQEDALLQCIKAKEKAVEDKLNIEVNFILCMMILGPASNTHIQNIETVKLARKYLNRGVCLLDLAGAETSSPMNDFRQYFVMAKEYGIPFTIHAGEQGDYRNVDMAIDFGAVRIGHGIHAIDSTEVISRLIDNDVTLEVCLTSNIQTKNQESFKEHCLKDLYTKGVKTTINTDNMTVSDITLENEYQHVLNEQKLGIDDIMNMMINSVDASFASEELKKELIKEYKQILEELR